MIPWQKYDPKNPPGDRKVRIVLTSGIEHLTAWYEWETETWRNYWDSEELQDVTHYAPINLPGEE
ncbi:hypothetical protein D3C76_455030 [compost metagenome]